MTNCKEYYSNTHNILLSEDAVLNVYKTVDDTINKIVCEDELTAMEITLDLFKQKYKQAVCNKLSPFILACYELSIKLLSV